MGGEIDELGETFSHPDFLYRRSRNISNISSIASYCNRVMTNSGFYATSRWIGGIFSLGDSDVGMGYGTRTILRQKIARLWQSVRGTRRLRGTGRLRETSIFYFKLFPAEFPAPVSMVRQLNFRYSRLLSGSWENSITAIESIELSFRFCQHFLVGKRFTQADV